MIPNVGLDNIAAYPAWGTSTGTGLSGSNADSSGGQWLAYAAISEDSAAPTATDTNIGAEKARTNSTGGFSRTATAIRNTDTNRLGVSIERAYVFAITESLNITKYGYVPVSSSGNFSWIDLTRVDPDDPMSTPVTLNLVNGDQLQLWQTFTLTVPWSVDLEQFVITGTAGNDTAGTHDAFCGFFATGDSLSTSGITLANLIGTLFWPGVGGAGNIIRAIATPQTPNAARDQSLASSTGSSETGFVDRQPYVSGTYQYDRNYSFATSEANFAITGILLTVQHGGQSANNGYGFKIVFSDPSTFVKANTHELSLTFRVSWAEG